MKFNKSFVIYLVIALFLVIGGFALGSNGNLSFMDAVAKFAGEYIGEKVFTEVKDELVMTISSEVKEKSFGGTTNYDSLELSENLTVAGTSLVSGTSTFSGITKTGILRTGGLRYASTTVKSVVLSSTALASYNFWDFSAGETVGATVNVTLPSTTTLSSFIPTVGEIAEIAIYNSTSSATNLTLVAGTGSLLTHSSTTATILPLSTAYLKAVRLNNTDIEFFLSN